MDNKLTLPPLGLGTYKLLETKAEEIIKRAYALGYRHFDTATFYENEHHLARALKGVDRKSYQITTKVWSDRMGYNESLKALDRSLNELQTPYVDLYLIHWPFPKNRIMETLEGIYTAKEKGRVLHVGVSNFTIHHLEDIKNEGARVEANQVEYHPYLNQEELLNYCLNEEIQLISYAPTARGEVLYDPVLNEIGKKYKKTAVQITLKWLIQKHIIAIPKTQREEKLFENFSIFDFTLADEDIARINQLHRNYRIVTPDCGDFDY